MADGLASPKPRPSSCIDGHRHPLLQHAFAKLAQGPFAPDAVEPRRVFRD